MVERGGGEIKRRTTNPLVAAYVVYMAQGRTERKEDTLMISDLARFFSNGICIVVHSIVLVSCKKKRRVSGVKGTILPSDTSREP